MTPPTRLLALACLLSFAVQTSLFAQSPQRERPGKARAGSSQRGAGQRGEARPEPKAMRVQKLSPLFEKILRNWAIATGRIKKLKGTHYKFEYDSVFKVDKRSKGTIYFEAPDKGRIDMEPVDTQGLVSSEKDKFGKPFTVRPGQREKWLCDGEAVYKINDAEKTYEKVVIPPQARGQNMMDGPLPFLFGMPPEKMKMRYELKLLGINEKAGKIRIEAKPRLMQDARHYRKAEIILNYADQSYLPQAVKLIDPTGNTTTVYVFKELEINKKDLNPFKADPFEPSELKKYKQVQIRNAQAPGSRRSGRLPSNGTRRRATRRLPGRPR